MTEPAYADQLRTQTLHAILGALGGAHVFGGLSDCGTILDSTEQLTRYVRHTGPGLGHMVTELYAITIRVDITAVVVP